MNSPLYVRALSPVEQAGRADGLRSSDTFPLHRRQICWRVERWENANRIDRLAAILLLLQGKKRTAGEIALHFEISKRTVLRDLEALSEMGIPITTGLGAAGGYTLPSEYSLPPLALTLHEALLLRLALNSLSQLGATPFKQARESLLAKVQTLLPRHEDENLEQLAQTLSLATPTRAYPTPFLDQLLESARASMTTRLFWGILERSLFLEVRSNVRRLLFLPQE